MAITHESAAQTSGNTANPSAPRAGGATAGQAGKMVIVAIGYPGTITVVPSGFTHIRTETMTVGWKISTYWKVHEGTTESATYTFTSDTSGRWVGIANLFVGVDTTTPIDVVDGQPNTSSVSVVAPSVDPNYIEDMLLFVGGIMSISSWTPDPAMTEPTNGERAAASTLSVGTAYQLLSSGAATGTRTATASIAATNAAILIGLKDAASTPDGGGAPADHPLAGTFTSVGIGVSLAALGNVPPVADAGVWSRGWYWNPAQGRVGRHFE